MSELFSSTAAAHRELHNLAKFLAKPMAEALKSQEKKPRKKKSLLDEVLFICLFV